jgi:hypothetical protein
MFCPTVNLRQKFLCKVDSLFWRVNFFPPNFPFTKYKRKIWREKNTLQKSEVLNLIDNFVQNLVPILSFANISRNTSWNNVCQISFLQTKFLPKKLELAHCDKKSRNRLKKAFLLNHINQNKKSEYIY